MRTPSMDKNGMKKGAWSTEEDQNLIDYIERYGIWNWTLMPKFAGLSRMGKSCRLRWVNYLNPQIKRGNISKEEEAIIMNMYSRLGKRWSAIARKLPGRTDNEIKNYWHTHLKKYFKERLVSKGMDVRHNVVVEDEDCTVDSSLSHSSIEVNDINGLDEMSSNVNGDSYSLWSQSITYENTGMKNDEESYVQGWYEEPSSPYTLYSNEYCFDQLLEADIEGTWSLSI